MEEKIKFSVGVVLPAAGCGERMKLSTPKQFCELNGRPLICYTINCFHSLPWIKSIVLSTSKDHVIHLTKLAELYDFHKVTVVEGGHTRHRSICLAVRALLKLSGDLGVVVIHDAVRPFVSQDLLQKIVCAAYDHGASGVSRPLVSTVIACDGDNKLVESLDRSRYVNSEMPQAFQPHVIANAYDKCTEDDFEYGTECLLLAMKYSSIRAKIIDGTPDLWKVTYRKDLFAAEIVVKEHFTKVALIELNGLTKLTEGIRTCLQSHHIQVTLQAEMSYRNTNPKVTLQAEVSYRNAAANSIASEQAANTFIILHSVHLTCPEDDAGLHQVTLKGDDCHSKGRRDGSGDPCVVQSSTTVNGAAGSRSASNIVELLQKVQTELLPPSQRPRLFHYSFIHVFVGCGKAQLLAALSSEILALSAQSKEEGILLYGLLCPETVVAHRVGEMAATLILHGHANFSGQLFLVN